MIVMLLAAARVSARPSTRETSSRSVLRSSWELRSEAMSPWARQTLAKRTEDRAETRMMQS
jgi:hypothetical protein